MSFSCVCTQSINPPQRHKQATYNTIRRPRCPFYPPVYHVFYRGRGRVQGKIRIPGQDRGRAQYFFKHRGRGRVGFEQIYIYWGWGRVCRKVPGFDRGWGRGRGRGPCRVLALPRCGVAHPTSHLLHRIVGVGRFPLPTTLPLVLPLTPLHAHGQLLHRS